MLITTSFTILLSACAPSVAGLQTRVDQATTVSTLGLPRIGTIHVYDLEYDRPSGLSIEDAASRGLLVNPGPAAWESAHYNREYDNPGNLVWSLGARMLIGNASDLVMGPEKWAYDESISAILFATGPTIAQGVGMPQLFEKEKEKQLMHGDIYDEAVWTVDKPLLTVGMGIGWEYDGDRDFKCIDHIDEKQRQDLEGLQNRITKLGGFVGLRGKCSESLMRRYGFSSFEVLGCPSLFINTNPQLGNILHTKFNALSQKVSTLHADLKVAVAMPGDYDERIMPFLAKVLLFFPKSILVNQNPNAGDHFSRACKDLGVEQPSRQSFMFYDALEWRHKLSQMDLVVSARIHGGMIAIAAETPTVVIPIDMRVLEMVRAMRVPHIMPADVPVDVRDFVVKAGSKFDHRAFDENRRSYAARYKEQFNKVGLTLNPELSRL